MAGVAGFEPTMTESESVALPLGDTPKIKVAYVLYQMAVNFTSDFSPFHKFFHKK